MDTRENDPRFAPDRCGRTHAAPGYWCSRDLGHDGPCAARPETDEDQLAAMVEMLNPLSGADAVPEEDQPFGTGCWWGALILLAVVLLVMVAAGLGWQQWG